MAFEVDELNASRRRQHPVTAYGITVLWLDLFWLHASIIGGTLTCAPVLMMWSGTDHGVNAPLT